MMSTQLWPLPWPPRKVLLLAEEYTDLCVRHLRLLLLPLPPLLPLLPRRWDWKAWEVGAAG